MKQLNIGDRIRIMDISVKSPFLNKIGIIIPIGGFGYENDDICVKIENTNELIVLKEHQVQKIDDK